MENSRSHLNDRVTVYHGESLSILSTLADGSADALVTDPPYSSGGMFRADRVNPATANKYTRRGKESVFSDFHGDNRDQRSFGYWMTLWLTQAYRVLKDGAPFCLFTDWRQLPTMTDAIQASGFSWRGVVVWDKKNGRPVKGRFRQSSEYVLWGSKGKMSIPDNAGYYPGMVSCSPDKGGRFHQTSKPVELMGSLLAIVPPGGLVIDPFMGAGSTGVAAIASGLSFMGIEYTRYYFEIARQRLSNNLDATV